MITCLEAKSSKFEEIKTSYTVDDDDSSIANFAFCVKKPGAYKINIEANGIGIFRSPFLCTFGCAESKLEAERKKQAEEDERRRKEGKSYLNLNPPTLTFAGISATFYATNS